MEVGGSACRALISFQDFQNCSYVLVVVVVVGSGGGGIKEEM